jgi:hypothetical protein
LGVGNAYKSGYPMAHSTNNFARMIKLQFHQDVVETKQARDYSPRWQA